MSKYYAKSGEKTPWWVGPRGFWIMLISALLVGAVVGAISFGLDSPVHAAPARVDSWDYSAQYLDLPNGKRIICVFYHSTENRLCR